MPEAPFHANAVCRRESVCLPHAACFCKTLERMVPACFSYFHSRLHNAVVPHKGYGATSPNTRLLGVVCSGEQLLVAQNFKTFTDEIRSEFTSLFG
jgi:hypothetical protein